MWWYPVYPVYEVLRPITGRIYSISRHSGDVRGESALANKDKKFHWMADLVPHRVKGIKIMHHVSKVSESRNSQRGAQQ